MERKRLSVRLTWSNPKEVDFSCLSIPLWGSQASYSKELWGRSVKVCVLSICLFLLLPQVRPSLVSLPSTTSNAPLTSSQELWSQLANCRANQVISAPSAFAHVVPSAYESLFPLSAGLLLTLLSKGPYPSTSLVR